MANEKRGFEKEYSENRFWEKIMAYARTAGKEVVEKALWLYYSAQHPKTPAWARSIIYGALGYFIFPIDAIPDLTPIAGYADDLGVLVAALATVAIYVNDEVKAKAADKIKAWFGDYFAMRRHIRRERNRQRADAAARLALRTAVKNGAISINEARSVHRQTVNSR